LPFATEFLKEWLEAASVALARLILEEELTKQSLLTNPARLALRRGRGRLFQSFLLSLEMFYLFIAHVLHLTL
jgi:hypothetical protein